MKKIIVFSFFCFISSFSYSNDELLGSMGFMKDNKRLIGNYKITNCIDEGWLSAITLQHKFHDLSNYEDEIKSLERMKEKGVFLQHPYEVRKEIIERIYHPKYPDIEYFASNEIERTRAILLSATERIDKCLGVR